MKNTIGQINAVARTTLPAAKNAGENVELLLDEYGRQPVVLQSPTGVDVVIDSDGHLVPLTHVENAVHAGKHYYIQGFTTLGNNTGVDDTLYVKLVTPAAPAECHFRWNIESGGILETHLYEAPSGGMTGGSNVVPKNNNRAVLTASAVVVTQDVAIATTLGTDISPYKVGGTGFKSVTGGADERSSELILKPSTIYLRTFLSTSEANIISFRADWIEE